jgi:hypothetical protein
MTINVVEDFNGDGTKTVTTTTTNPDGTRRPFTRALRRVKCSRAPDPEYEIDEREYVAIADECIIERRTTQT